STPSRACCRMSRPNCKCCIRLRWGRNGRRDSASANRWSPATATSPRVLSHRRASCALRYHYGFLPDVLGVAQSNAHRLHRQQHRSSVRRARTGDRYPLDRISDGLGLSAPDRAGRDAIWQQGGAVAEQLWDKGGVFGGDFGYYLAGGVVWLLIGLLCVYAMFLIALSSTASAVLLATGPFFTPLLLFDSPRRYFEAWIAQLATYALISILTVLVAALLLQIVESYAAQTAARGAA